jgi:prepilin-type N-terminal cleavage/methylation domain-containing protein
MPVRRPDRAGFTLVELLVALVISGILAGVIFQLLLGQGRVSRVQTAREEVQQNARAALEVVTAELRGVGKGGLVTADADELSFFSPRAWGLVCGQSAAGLAVVYPPAAPPPTGVGALAIGDASWTFFEHATDATATSDLTDAVKVCNNSLTPEPAFVVDVSQPAARPRRVYAGVSGAAPAPGTPAYVFERITYTIGMPAGLDGDWILRNGEPLAGPVPADGLRFAYLDQNGAETSTPDQVVAVRVSVRTESRARFNDAEQTETGSTVVFLRNRS